MYGVYKWHRDYPDQAVPDDLGDEFEQSNCRHLGWDAVKQEIREWSLKGWWP